MKGLPGLTAVIAAAIAAFAVLAGCSNKPPVISRVYARVIYQHDIGTGANSEGLSVFLVASDPNGTENLSSFHVINDDAELFWKVNSTSWMSATAEGETWIGSNTLVMPGSEEVPAGSYRVLLQNAGGDTTEETFTVSARAVKAAAAAYPAASVSDGAIHLSGPYDSMEIWTYGKDGKFVSSFAATRKGPPLEVQKMVTAFPALGPGFTFRVFANNAKGGYGALAGPYAVAATPAPAGPIPAPVGTLPGK